MSARKIKLFTIGYPDNTETNFLLDYFMQNGINIDGVIFAKSQIKRDWKRFIKKIHMRGFSPALKRICENLIVRKKQISKLCHQNIDSLTLGRRYRITTQKLIARASFGGHIQFSRVSFLFCAFCGK